MEREFEKHLLSETKSNNQIRYGCLGETSLSEYYIHNKGLFPDTLISSSSVSLLGHGIRCHKHACHEEVAWSLAAVMWALSLDGNVHFNHEVAVKPFQMASLHSEGLGIIISL